jgi:hypothetical protein
MTQYALVRIETKRYQCSVKMNAPACRYRMIIGKDGYHTGSWANARRKYPGDSPGASLFFRIIAPGNQYWVSPKILIVFGC